VDGAIIRSGGTALDLRRLSAEELLLTLAKPVDGIVDLGNAQVSVLCDDPATWPADITMGSIVFAWRPPPPLDPATSQHFNSLVYTINLLLPVGQFVQPDQWNPGGAERWFAYALVGTGWLLATAVIAG